MKTLSKILAVALLAACAEINPQTATDAPENEIILKENGAQTRAAQALEPGDEIGLFAVKAAQPLQPKNNAINNAKLLMQSDLTIKGEQTIYYPNRMDKVDFYSYFPYQSGDATADALGVLVGIRTTQTDTFSLKSSDVCYGSAKGVTPTNSAQSITYVHAFAQLKLNFSAYPNCPAIKSVKLLNIKDSVSLNLATGALTLRSHLAEITPQKLTATDPNSKGEYLAIIPAQKLQGACVAVTLTDYTTYIYSITTPIALTAGATSILNLSIVDKSTIQIEATPTITAWQPITATSSTTQSIDNQITLRWLVPHPSFSTVDKIVLTLVDMLGNSQDVEVAPALDPTSTATYALYTCALQIEDKPISYPLAVTRLRLYAGAELLRDTPQAAIIASQIARRGAHTLGLHLSAVRIGNLWWSTMNVGATKPEEYGSYINWNDALTVCPSGWRLPTSAEFGSPSQYGPWTTYNGVYGRWFGPTNGWNSSNAIFFPAAGELSGGAAGPGLGAYYWSSTSGSSSHAYLLCFHIDKILPQHYNYYNPKSHRYAIRCVQ